MAGVLAVDDSGRLLILPRGRVVLATGGIGGLYRRHHQSAGRRRQGLALAARAGAVLADLEFVQFHPTALDVGRRARCRWSARRCAARAPCSIDETRRAVHGGRARRRAGAARRRGARRSGATRAGGHACSSMRGRIWATGFRSASRRSPRSAARPASIRRTSRSRSGRRRTTTWAASPWTATAAAPSPACGPAARSAATGLHGANRLASNSLLEAVVCARWVAGERRPASRRRCDARGPRCARRPRPMPIDRAADRVASASACCATAPDLSAAIAALLPLADGDARGMPIRRWSAC